MENQKKMQEQEPSSTKKRTRRTKAEIEAEKQKETVKEESMTEEIEEGVYYTNNAEANGEEKFEITKAGYYGYLFFKCYKQVQVPNELDEVRENVISINIEQFKKVGGKKEFDDHSFVMKLKADYNKVVLIHDCTLISEVDRKNAKKELKLNK